MANRILSTSESLKQYVEQVIEEERLNLQDAKLECVMVSPEISKLKPAQLIVANEDLEYFGEFHYLLKISEAHWNAFADAKGSLDLRRALICHQLAKIYIKTSKKGVTTYSKRDSEISGFRWVFKQFGYDYKNDMEVITSSIYDFAPEDMESGITL
jgi:hypothetical protein